MVHESSVSLHVKFWRAHLFTYSQFRYHLKTWYFQSAYPIFIHSFIHSFIQSHSLTRAQKLGVQALNEPETPSSWGPEWCDATFYNNVQKTQNYWWLEPGALPQIPLGKLLSGPLAGGQGACCHHPKTPPLLSGVALASGPDHPASNRMTHEIRTNPEILFLGGGDRR